MPWWDVIPKIAFFNNVLPKEEQKAPLTTQELTEYLQKARELSLTLEDLRTIISRTSRKDALKFCQVASRIRDELRGRILTYSRNIFIPVTKLCRNACFYCTFRRPFVQRGREFISEREVTMLLERAKKLKVTEVLFTTGERAEYRYKNAMKWLKTHDFDSTIEYVYHLGEKCLDVGLLPHINAGALMEDEMKMLKEVSASMGLMLENVSVRLTRKNEVHHAAPDKHPRYRLETHILAGKYGVPWTTGILLGIGEAADDVARSLHVIKTIHQRYGGFIQEIIVQNFQPKSGTVMKRVSPPDPEYVKFIVALARCYLPREIGVQVPPNLNRGHEVDFIHSGICDWGGVSPLTKDHVNPEMPWPREKELYDISVRSGFVLRRRLPLYPRFVASKWTSERVWETLERYKLADEKGFSSK